jgi:hypothetical protein
MTKEERLDFLIDKKNELNKTIRTIEDFDKFESFVRSEIAHEEQFEKGQPEMSDSFMLSLLKNVQIKLKLAKESIKKNNTRRAFDLFEMALRHLNEDYDFTIGEFKSKNKL